MGAARILDGTTRMDIAKVTELYLAETKITATAEQLNAVVGSLEVYNGTGDQLDKGTLVYISGYNAANSAFSVDKADADYPGKQALLVLKEDIANAAVGTAEFEEVITGLNTNSYTVGDKVYLSATAGEWGAAPTGSDQFVQEVGVVTVKNATTGAIHFYPGRGIITKIGTSMVQDGAISKAKTDAGVQASLDLADAAVQAGATLRNFRAAQLQLNGVNPTPVVFQSDTAASLVGTETETFDLTGVGDGGTILADTDGLGEETATINFAAGYHTGDTNPSIDMSSETDNKFKIQVDDDVGGAQEVTCDWTGCNSGALIAAEMQSKIQALGGVYAGVTVSYNGSPVTDYYKITSGTSGTGSKVRITDGDTFNCTEELKIGTTGGGSDTDGTGDVDNAAAATAQEIVDVINTDMNNLTAEVSSGAIKLTSDTLGRGSSIVMGNSTLKTVLGLAQSASNYGAQGMGYDSDMENANYLPMICLLDVAQASLASLNVNAKDRATSGFDIECETAASEAKVIVYIFGQEAS